VTFTDATATNHSYRVNGSENVNICVHTGLPAGPETPGRPSAPWRPKQIIYEEYNCFRKLHFPTHIPRLSSLMPLCVSFKQLPVFLRNIVVRISTLLVLLPRRLLHKIWQCFLQIWIQYIQILYMLSYINGYLSSAQYKTLQFNGSLPCFIHNVTASRDYFCNLPARLVHRLSLTFQIHPLVPSPHVFLPVPVNPGDRGGQVHLLHQPYPATKTINMVIQ